MCARHNTPSHNCTMAPTREDRVLATYLRLHPRAPPRDPRHLRCTAECTMWHHRHACVCVASRRVHLCGNDCTEPGRPTQDGDGVVCPLTNIVTSAQVLTQTPQFTKASRPVVHWTNTKIKSRGGRTRQKPRTRRPKRTKVIAATLACMQPTILRKTVHAENAARRLRRAATFESAAACVHAANPRLHYDPAAMKMACEAIGGDLHTYLVHNAGALCVGSVDVHVAVLLTLLSSGWDVGGVHVVQHVPFVANTLPLPVHMNNIARVQCRSISVGVRAVKRYALTDDGTPIYNRRLTLSRQTLRQLYNTEVGATPCP